MSVSFIFSVFLLLCVIYEETDPSSKGTYRMCIGLGN
jgi:hypothetical protein